MAASAVLCGCSNHSTTTQQLGPGQQSERLRADTTRGGGSPTPNEQVGQTPSSDAQTKQTVDRDQRIQQAHQLVANQNLEAAASILRGMLLTEPGDVEVLFTLSTIEAANGNLENAVDLLSEIPEEHPEAGLPALGQSADWCFQLKRYAEAERRYLRLLERAPEAARARRQLAYLLNRQGRRHEAAVHVRELCKQGNIRQEELQSLIVLSDAMYDDPSDTAKPRSEDQMPYWPIGLLADARKLFNQERYEEAAAKLHAAVEDGSALPAALAFYGRAVIEAQNDQRFTWWLSRVDEPTKEFSEYWAAIGAYLLSERRFEEATRALAEAIDRDPTDLMSIGRLRQALLILGDDATAQQWTDRWKVIRGVLHANNRIADSPESQADAIADLATKLQELQRPLEAILWKSLEAHYRGMSPQTLNELNRQRQEIVASGRSFPSRSQRLCEMEFMKYPEPKLAGAPARAVKSIKPRRNDLPSPAQFENVAEQVGLDHAFLVGAMPQESGFSIYQLLGGAVAVLDYDLDGACDLYFAQGGADPPTFISDDSNRLFRQTNSRLTDVTQLSETSEYRYSTGLTAGDWNQDGFADLVIANLGNDALLINNGDGTFTRQALIETDGTSRVSSSLAVADLTGDALPDLFQACYIDDSRMAMKPPRNEQGQVIQPMLPTGFKPGPNRLLRNDGVGGFQLDRFNAKQDQVSTSLGVVVSDFDDKPGNEIFVGNDLRPNQLWVRDSPDSGWSDVAPLLGCAFGHLGAPTASMGIAAGDFDANGSLDLHVTNYEGENVSLFLGEGGAYQDRNVQFQLAAASNPVLGFGTQATDYDNDGRPDLVVTNGHIENAAQINAPFMQPPQLFANLGDRFELVDVADDSGYWSSKHLGRALAKLDFNRDGKHDFVITHIGERSALLVNQTPTNHHWLQLKLIGTESERDGIGARVRVRFGKHASTDWVIAGDGYLCHNEEMLAFGLGDAENVDEIVIRWPTGNQQTIQNVRSDQRLLIIENERHPYRSSRL